MLIYDAESGLFTWRRNPAMGPRVQGKRAGGIRNGYWLIRLDTRKYQAHRLAWLYVTGEWPTEIDHRNRIRSDNRFRNLRFATHQQNVRNQTARRNSSSGVAGVTWRPDVSKWRVRVADGKKRHDIGYFDDIRLAAAARRNVERRLFGEFAPT